MLLAVKHPNKPSGSRRTREPRVLGMGPQRPVGQLVSLIRGNRQTDALFVFGYPRSPSACRHPVAHPSASWSQMCRNCAAEACQLEWAGGARPSVSLPTQMAKQALVVQLLFSPACATETSDSQQGASTLGVRELGKPIALRCFAEAPFKGTPLYPTPQRGEQQTRAQNVYVRTPRASNSGRAGSGPRYSRPRSNPSGESPHLLSR